MIWQFLFTATLVVDARHLLSKTDHLDVQVLLQEIEQPEDLKVEQPVPAPTVWVATEAFQNSIFPFCVSANVFTSDSKALILEWANITEEPKLSDVLLNVSFTESGNWTINASHSTIPNLKLVKPTQDSTLTLEKSEEIRHKEDNEKLNKDLQKVVDDVKKSDLSKAQKDEIKRNLDEMQTDARDMASKVLPPVAMYPQVTQGLSQITINEVANMEPNMIREELEFYWHEKLVQMKFAQRSLSSPGIPSRGLSGSIGYLHWASDIISTIHKDLANKDLSKATFWDVSADSGGWMAVLVKIAIPEMRVLASVSSDSAHAQLIENAKSNSVQIQSGVGMAFDAFPNNETADFMFVHPPSQSERADSKLLQLPQLPVELQWKLAKHNIEWDMVLNGEVTEADMMETKLTVGEKILLRRLQHNSKREASSHISSDSNTTAGFKVLEDFAQQGSQHLRQGGKAWVGVEPNNGWNGSPSLNETMHKKWHLKEVVQGIVKDGILMLASSTENTINEQQQFFSAWSLLKY